MLDLIFASEIEAPKIEVEKEYKMNVAPIDTVSNMNTKKV